MSARQGHLQAERAIADMILWRERTDNLGELRLAELPGLHVALEELQNMSLAADAIEARPRLTTCSAHDMDALAGAIAVVHGGNAEKTTEFARQLRVAVKMIQHSPHAQTLGLVLAYALERLANPKGQSA